MKKLVALSLFAAGACVLAGCGQEASPESITVSGTVALDDTPVARGQIIFSDPSRQTRSSGGDIVDGKFTFDASPGSKRVEIIAMREVPGKMDTSNPGEERPLMEQYIPDKYNAESDLTAEVSPSNTTFDFKLETGD
jgi:hypothetical protein